MINFKKKKLSGASLIEFALLLAIMILLIDGIIELSILHINKYVLLSACREGARYGINYSNSSYPTKDQISTFTGNLLSKKLISFSSIKSIPIVTVTSSDNQPTPGSTLTVSANYNYTDYILHYFINSDPQYNLSASITMVYQ